MSKSTKDKRDAHFKAKKSGPAPGDSAETKPSKHTKKFKQMFGEKSIDEGRAKQAVAGRKVQKLVTAHGLKFKGKVYKEIDMELVKINNSTEMVTFNIIHPPEIFGNETNISFKALKRGPFMATDTSKINEVLPDSATQKDYIDDFEKSDAPQFQGKSKEKRREMAIAAYLSKNEDFTHYPGQVDPKKDKKDGDWVKGDPEEPIDFDGSDTKSILDKANKEVEKERKVKVKPFVESFQLDEKIAGLVKKADKSGMPYSILKKVYDRGMAAWKTGHRPGTTPQQWAFARVNSFTTKSAGTWGKADKDLAKQVEQIEEACWDGYKQVGMKKKGDKEVPNCVPEDNDLNEWGEITEKDDKSGKELNNPTKGDVKKYKVYVRNDKGNVVKVEFGDPNMEIKRDDPERRKAFRARHNCDQKKDKTTAGYWSCKFWSGKSVTDLMKG
jgi:hypothetical protein